MFYHPKTRIMEKNISIIVAQIMPFVENFLRGIVREEVEHSLQADREKAKPEKMLTREEVCELAHISKVTLWQKEKEGKIRAQRIGRRVLFAESEIKRVLEGGLWRKKE